MDKWGDGGIYEGCDEDTASTQFEAPYVREPVRWVLEQEVNNEH